jgi:MoxR-like ATPase
MTAENVKAFMRDFEALRSEMEKVIVGYRDVVENTLICFFAGGNLLIESAPGLGKTLIAKTLSRVLEIKFSRIQFTPDLMPADILGTTVVQESADGKKHFVFEKGPIFTQLLLADEINRATPKTQSALLEAMQERRVTVGGKTHDLDKPYFVIATMNAQETGGTYSLPEAQLDRFFFKVNLEKPSIEALQEISSRASFGGTHELRKIIDAKRAEEMKALVLAAHATSEARKAAIELILRTHPSSEMASKMSSKYLRYGSSPRGAQALILGGKVRALLRGSNKVTPEDIAKVAKPILGHRLNLNFEAEADGVSASNLIDDALKSITGSAA